MPQEPPVQEEVYYSGKPVSIEILERGQGRKKPAVISHKKGLQALKSLVTLTFFMEAAIGFEPMNNGFADPWGRSVSIWKY
jgi:hypothetical protein